MNTGSFCIDQTMIDYNKRHSRAVTCPPNNRFTLHHFNKEIAS